MIERWERTAVVGTDGENREHREIVVHKVGANVLEMAFRRNQGLAGCSRVWTESVPAFSMERQEEKDERRRIPRSRTDEEEWDW